MLARVSLCVKKTILWVSIHQMVSRGSQGMVTGKKDYRNFAFQREGKEEGKVRERD